MNLISIFRHRIKIFLWLINKKSTPLDFLGEAVVSISARWQTELNPFLSYVGMFDVLRQRNFSGKFLELGGGFSTVLLTNILNIEPKLITSVDLNPSKYNWILNSPQNRTIFLSMINNVQRPTVALEEVFLGLETIRIKLSMHEKDKLISALNKYITSDIASSEYVAECIFSKNGDALKRLLTEHHAYEEDLKFYKSCNYEEGSGFCTDLVMAGYKADAIFFDCGEVSSVGEWAILEETFQVGSYALFHDIYYPKSIKNFLIVSYLDLSDDWEIVYIDSSSLQGALVAIKIS